MSTTKGFPVWTENYNGPRLTLEPLKVQLLKWVGNKQRFAEEIISYFPAKFNTYYEPFMGSGAIIASLAPRHGIGADGFKPLAQLWQQFEKDHKHLGRWYQERWKFFQHGDSKQQYEQIKARYNKKPNPADLLFLSRSCYGGVVRFRKTDGYMSTPVGPHKPIHPKSFLTRLNLWKQRLSKCQFIHSDFRETMDLAERGDLIYCDPPYSDSQKILYGAQAFSLEELFDRVADCKRRGVHVALSLDGSKKSGKHQVHLKIPKSLFKKQLSINCGRSMLKRFQMHGRTLEMEVVADRLLLTY